MIIKYDLTSTHQNSIINIKIQWRSQKKFIDFLPSQPKYTSHMYTLKTLITQ